MIFFGCFCCFRHNLIRIHLTNRTIISEAAELKTKRNEFECWGRNKVIISSMSKPFYFNRMDPKSRYKFKITLNWNPYSVD